MRFDTPIRHPLRWAFAVALLTLVAATPAAAIQQGPYSLDLLVNGTPLAEYASRAATYVEAIEEREYSIRIRNHTGERIAVAVAVDGLNSIDAKSTTARQAAKWILGPYETVTLDGWQTGSSTARRFFFTTEERSYGEWLGKTANLGVISAAVFREMPQPAPMLKSEAPRRSRMPAAAGEGKRMESFEEPADTDSAESELSDDLAATGIGREIAHRVRRVRFEVQASPAAVLELRYEYHDALVRLGVLPPSYAHSEHPLDRRERAHGFRDSDFAPDPYRP